MFLPSRSLESAYMVAILAGACSAAAAGDAAFSDQTAAAGINASHQGGGTHSFLAGGAVGDFNGDGWTDIYFPPCGTAADKLYINNQNGTFSDRAADWGIDFMHRGTGAAVADFDDDGFLDIFVTSLGPIAQGAAPGKHRLYRNIGGSGFVDVAVGAGVNFSSPVTPDGWGAAWGDFDLDGDLDLAVAGWQNGSDGNRLFRNNGNGTFTDVTIAAGLSNASTIAGFAPRFVDMNGDRYPEIIWIGDFATGKYYANNSNGTFTDVTVAAGVNTDGTEMGTTVADFDEDGLFDFYVTTINTNNLYINQGDHVYSNQGDQAGVSFTGWGWGTVAIDFNHDRLVDLVATTQSDRQYAFENTSSGVALSFAEVALQIGIDTTVSGRGLSNLDYDNDGDQDLVIFPRDDPVRLYRNDLSGPDINWIRVFLDAGNVPDIAPGGIGSVIELTADGRTTLGRIDGGSNYLSQSEMSAHFGLGDAAIIDELRVKWTNGDVSVLTNVAINQTITISADEGPTLPAVSSWGFMAMVLALGVAGTMAFRFKREAGASPAS